jgi:pentatricopeptide repeat protein
MTKAGLEPGSAATRPIYLYLTQDPSLPLKAWDILQDMYDNGHVVPIAAVNVVIEACVTNRKLDEAVELYKQIHKICETGPNTETFNVILQGASRTKGKDFGMFIASEMRALGVNPDHLTYDRLIMICAKEEDYEDAFLYLEEMIKVGAERLDNGRKGWWMRNGTASYLVRRCIASRDNRAWQLLDEMDERGLDTEKLKVSVEQMWKGEPKVGKVEFEEITRRAVM